MPNFVIGPNFGLTAQLVDGRVELRSGGVDGVLHGTVQGSFVLDIGALSCVEKINGRATMEVMNVYKRENGSWRMAAPVAMIVD